MGTIRRMGTLRNCPCIWCCWTLAYGIFPQTQAVADTSRDHGNICCGIDTVGDIWITGWSRIMAERPWLPGVSYSYRLALDSNGTRDTCYRRRHALAVSFPVSGYASCRDALVYEHGLNAVFLGRSRLNLGAAKARVALVWPADLPNGILGGYTVKI